MELSLGLLVQDIWKVFKEDDAFFYGICGRRGREYIKTCRGTRQKCLKFRE